MYRGRTSIGEVLNLPNRVFTALLQIRSDRLKTDAGQQEESAELMSEELEGGV